MSSASLSFKGTLGNCVNVCKRGTCGNMFNIPLLNQRYNTGKRDGEICVCVSVYLCHVASADLK